MPPLITQDHIEAFQKDGVVLIKGRFKNHIETLRDGIAKNMAAPSEFANKPT